MSTRYQRTFAPEATLTDEEEDGTIDTSRDVVPVQAEDKNWKDRYGNLRSHTQKQLNDAEAKIKQLQDSIAALSKDKVDLPTSEADLEAWIQRYPDIAKIFETIAIKKARETGAEYDRKFEALATKEENNAKEKAQIELGKLHPDFFDEIRNDEKFHAWLGTKAVRTQDAIYQNDLDYQAAADVITLYKLENAVAAKTSTRQPSAKDIARDVSPSRRPAPGGNGQFLFKESQIERMSAAEFGAMEAEITKAISEGRVEMDISSQR